jgi:hypothetical protein
MTGFKADCTINLHVENRGKTGRLTWCCSVVHHSRGRIVLARKLADDLSREDAQREAVLFGLQQTQRLLQEKVDIAANFPVEGMLPEGENMPGRGKGGGVKSKQAMSEDIAKAWLSFRLRRVTRMAADEAELLRKEAAQA